MDFTRQEILQTLVDHWGYDSFRACQEEIITSVLSGHDTLGLMPTGGGKSITFQVPALLLDGLTIVVTPLVSLMKDQVDNLKSRRIKAAYLCAGMAKKEIELVEQRALYGKIKLLYLSPEKIASQRFRNRLRAFPVSLIVVDEAHCISQWGYDFRPLYLRTGELRRLFPEAPVLALTASATPEVAEDIRSRLSFRPGHNTFTLSFRRDNISYLMREAEDKVMTMARILNAVPGSAIVYVRSRIKTKEYAEALRQYGIEAEYYHAGLETEDKGERQSRWKDGKTRVIVATNAFGMGIDKPDVRLVLHADMPPSLEEYYQEAGRAGRDGLPSYAVMVLGRYDRGSLSRKLALAFPPKDEVRRVYGLLASYFSLSPGEGYDTAFEFNLEQFCRTFRLFPENVQHILNLLTHIGVIEYVEEISMRSRLMMTMFRDELYSYPFTPQQERIMQVILRKYTGIFADYEFISEPALCASCNMKEEEVYQNLISLRRAHVIDYIPKKTTPYIYYVTAQEEPEHLLIPLEAYEYRLTRMKKRMEFMQKFAFATDCCRVRLMLEYFGEQDAQDCGKCDWCRARSASETRPRKQDEVNLRQWILAQTAGARLSIMELLDRSGYTSATDRSRLTSALRTLADEGKLRIDGSFVCGE